jgi:hypothetical protein
MGRMVEPKTLGAWVGRPGEMPFADMVPDARPICVVLLAHARLLQPASPRAWNVVTLGSTRYCDHGAWMIDKYELVSRKQSANELMSGPQYSGRGGSKSYDHEY